MTRDQQTALTALGVIAGAAGLLGLALVLTKKPKAAAVTWDVPNAAIMAVVDGVLNGGAVAVGKPVVLQSGGKPVTVLVDSSQSWAGQGGAHGWNYVGHVILSSVPGLAKGASVTFGDQNIFALLDVMQAPS